MTEGRPTRYVRPAIEARFETKARLGEVISGGGGDSQPVWRSKKAGKDRED